MNNTQISKHVKSVLTRINLFENGLIPLYELVNDLITLQDRLEEYNPSWLEQFDALRFSLEEVNAIRLDESFSGADENDCFLKQTLQKIKLLIMQSKNRRQACDT